MSSLDNRQATLENLSFTLRHPDMWPNGFEWNYSDCNRCAMGLAHKMWPKIVREPTTSAMVSAFGINDAKAADIFTGAARGDYSGFGVTATRVADLIDELLG